MALVSLVETSRQSFLARTGIDLEETPREQSFCAHAMLRPEVMVVPNATLDHRFADNPLVTGEANIRFYAGAPLVTEDGIPFGALCVIDTVPRPAGLTAIQRQGLETLAANVIARMRDSRDAAAWRHAENDARRRLHDSDSRFHVLADTMPQMVWSALADGYVDYWNARWYAFTGVAEGSTDGEGWNGMFHPDDQARAWATWRHSLVTGEPYEIEYRLRRRDGVYRWVLGRALPMRDDSDRIVRWFGTCTEIHEQREAAEERELVANELNHRIKNLLSVISSIVMLSTRGRPELSDAAGELVERISALGRANDLVRPTGSDTGEATTLRALIATLLAPYRTVGGGIVLGGGDVPVTSASATPLALLFHELATNAAKYGALSDAAGEVRIDIAADAETITLTWQELGGPHVAAPPDRTGFGTRVIDQSVQRQLGGVVRRVWRPEGLRVEMELATKKVAPGGSCLMRSRG